MRGAVGVAGEQARWFKKTVESAQGSVVRHGMHKWDADQRADVFSAMTEVQKAFSEVIALGTFEQAVQPVEEAEDSALRAQVDALRAQLVQRATALGEQWKRVHEAQQASSAASESNVAALRAQLSGTTEAEADRLEQAAVRAAYADAIEQLGHVAGNLENVVERLTTANAVIAKSEERAKNALESRNDRMVSKESERVIHEIAAKYGAVAAQMHFRTRLATMFHEQMCS